MKNSAFTALSAKCNLFIYPQLVQKKENRNEHPLFL
jgi:hypothetical protein